MSQSSADLVAAARTQVENLTPEQVAREVEGGATLVDVREEHELREAGRIPGSVHAPRGMLEFYADPSSPYHRQEFERDARIILHCAAGARSALSAATLRQLGYTNVAHLDGGMKAWTGEGMPVERDS